MATNPQDPIHSLAAVTTNTENTENPTDSTEKKQAKAPKLPTRPLYNPSRENHEPLRVFGYALTEEELVAWLPRNGIAIHPDEVDPEYEALEEIDDRLQGPTARKHLWVAVKHHVDREIAHCFPVGSNRNQAGLENAKNWARIRRFQNVLGIEKGVLPRWYKVVEP